MRFRALVPRADRNIRKTYQDMIGKTADKKEKEI